MTPRIAAFAAFIGLLVVALLAPGRSQAKGVRLGEEFTMHIGNRVKVTGPKIVIDFVDVVEDSRCPTDVVCAWAGNAKIHLQLQWKGREPKAMLLNTLQTPVLDKFKKYVVKLVKLEPLPVSNGQIDKGDYVATLIVVPADSEG